MMMSSVQRGGIFVKRRRGRDQEQFIKYVVGVGVWVCAWVWVCGGGGGGSVYEVSVVMSVLTLQRTEEAR